MFEAMMLQYSVLFGCPITSYVKCKVVYQEVNEVDVDAKFLTNTDEVFRCFVDKKYDYILSECFSSLIIRSIFFLLLFAQS